MDEYVIFDKITLGANGVGWALDDKNNFWMTRNSTTCVWELVKKPTVKERDKAVQRMRDGKS